MPFLSSLGVPYQRLLGRRSIRVTQIFVAPKEHPPLLAVAVALGQDVPCLMRTEKHSDLSRQKPTRYRRPLNERRVVERVHPIEGWRIESPKPLLQDGVW